MRIVAALLALLGLLGPAAGWADDQPAVRAVLFVSPTCPHCRIVKEQALPAFAERFGSRLELAVVNAATPAGLEVFRAACLQYGVQRPGVPMLITRDYVLLGSEQIPKLFPMLAEGVLAAGGSPWPEVPGLAALIAAEEEPDPESRAASNVAPASEAGPHPAGTPMTRPTPVAEAAASPGDVATSRSRPSEPPTGHTPRAARSRPVAAPDDERPGLLDRLAMDPYGNSLAVAVLMVMMAVAGRSVVLVRRALPIRGAPSESRAIPLLSLAGLGVASYLSWVEIGGRDAVCGPVGDCNTVQQSEYAILFGVVPIGVLGVVGFAATLGAWLLGRLVDGRVREIAGLALLALTGFGTLFSIYLTFLEPFVIGATCAWCLTSATIMTLLYWLSLRPAQRSVRDLAQRARPGTDRRAGP